MKKKCFVIQPFDGGIFDRRYNEVFEPAIINASLFPYRVDKDVSVRVPIHDIEQGIIDSVICFADITTDNPNVWYELGYAFACGKDVVMVCSSERDSNFPFDIQHRYVIKYQTGSKSDFDYLEKSITEKLGGYLQKSSVIGKLQNSNILNREGLNDYEIAILVILMGHSIGMEEGLSVENLKNEMHRAGYNSLAAGVGVVSLKKKFMIEEVQEDDGYSNYTTCRLTVGGQQWILDNTDKLNFRVDESKQATQEEDIEIEDLPF